MCDYIYEEISIEIFGCFIKEANEIQYTCCDVWVTNQQLKRLNKDLFVKYRKIYTEGERYYSNQKLRNHT